MQPNLTNRPSTSKCFPKLPPTQNDFHDNSSHQISFMSRKPSTQLKSKTVIIPAVSSTHATHNNCNITKFSQKHTLHTLYSTPRIVMHEKYHKLRKCNSNVFKNALQKCVNSSASATKESLQTNLANCSFNISNITLVYNTNCHLYKIKNAKLHDLPPSIKRDRNVAPIQTSSSHQRLEKYIFQEKNNKNHRHVFGSRTNHLPWLGDVG